MHPVTLTMAGSGKVTSFIIARLKLLAEFPPVGFFEIALAPRAPAACGFPWVGAPPPSLGNASGVAKGRVGMQRGMGMCALLALSARLTIQFPFAASAI